jgi:predicted ATPase
VGEEQIVLFANLLSISLCGRYSPLDFGPQLQKERTMSVLVDQIVGHARKQPVLIVVEDAHWLDITSQQLLQLLFERVDRLPIMILITSRSETYPSFVEALPITRLSLGRLGRRDAMAMLQQLTDSKVLPPEVSIDILEKTDGVPLFIEELTKTALEIGLLQAAGDGYVRAKPTFALPATLHGSMTARLDSVGAAKEVAQVAAVIGREFSAELLCLVMQQTGAKVATALRQLEAVAILVRKSTDRETTYVFRHALLQSAAYETLLLATRRELHRRIVTAIEAQFPETALRHPDLLAYHCARSGLFDKAIKYLQEAGLRAASRSAHIEAIAHFRGALDLLRSLPDTLKRDRAELEVQVALGGALLAGRGYAVPEAVQAHQEIGRLCDKLGDSPETFPALFGQWIFFAGRAELPAAQNVASRLSRIAQASDDGVTKAIAFHAAGISAFWNGDFEKARSQLAQAVEFGESHRDELFAHFQFRDRVLLSASYLSWSLFILGFPNEAFKNWNTIWEKFEERSDPYVQVIALTNACYLYQFSRDWRAVLKQAGMVHSLASQRKFPVFVTVSMILRGWALANNSELEAGMKEVRDGLKALRDGGAQEELAYLYALAAEVLARGKQTQSALNLIDAAIAEIERTGELWFMAELYRLRGEFLLLEPGREAEARISLDRAVAVAREQSAQTWQLRAATSLGRMMIRQGLVDEARELVRPVCDWFGGNCDLPDFADARTLLSAR